MWSSGTGTSGGRLDAGEQLAQPPLARSRALLARDHRRGVAGVEQDHAALAADRRSIRSRTPAASSGWPSGTGQ